MTERAARSRSRRRWITACIVGCCVLALLPWLAIRMETWTHVGPVAGDHDHADAALVLGARVYADGTASPFLRERVATGAELYKAGDVDRIIMSGDGNDSSGFGEPSVMRAIAEEMGAYPPPTLHKGTVVGNLRELPAAAKAWLDVARGTTPGT